MTHTEIVSRLSRLIDNPTSEVLYAIRTQEVLTAIACRMGEDALSLSADDLQLAIVEVKEAISHNLDERDFIDMGLDAWEITRHL